MSLSNKEFNHIKSLPKTFKDDNLIVLGPPPLKWVKEVVSSETRDQFLLNFHRSSFELKKYTVNKRYRKSLVIGRFDSRGTHTNPDGTKFTGPHVHIYDEKYGDKIAYPIDILGLDEDSTMEECLEKFLVHFNFIEIPKVQSSLI